MEIKAGRYYKTRDRQKVGPIKHRPEAGQSEYWEADMSLRGGARAAWYQDGSFWPVGSHLRDKENADFDLVAEWTDTPDLTATDYNDGKWHGWNGGECPVDQRTEVRIFDGTSCQDITLPAECVHWTFRGAFMVVTLAPPQPREWWISGGNCLWDTYTEAYNACDHGENPIRVREVTD